HRPGKLSFLMRGLKWSLKRVPREKLTLRRQPEAHRNSVPGVSVGRHFAGDTVGFAVRGGLRLRGREHAEIRSELELAGDVQLGSYADEADRVEALAARAREIHARPLGAGAELNIGRQH